MAILVLADHDNAHLSDQTAKALTAATKIGSDVHVLVAGAGAKAAAEQAAKLSGVSKVLVAEDASLANNLADARKRYRQAAKRDIRRERSVHDSRVQQLLDRVVQQEYVRSAHDDHRQAIRDRLARALKRLPRAKRAIIVWVHIKGIPLKVVAERVGKKYDATRQFWKRALLQLKQELEKDDDKPV